MSDIAVTSENPVLESSVARRRYAFLILAVAVVATPFLLVQGPLAGLARDTGLLATSDRFSALALPDYAQLPLRVVAGQPVDFYFTITNQEGHTLTYRWRAQLSAPKGRATLESGSVAVPSGVTREVMVKGSAPRLPGADAVRVNVAGQSEAVEFHLRIVKPGSGS